MEGCPTFKSLYESVKINAGGGIVVAVLEGFRSGSDFNRTYVRHEQNGKLDADVPEAGFDMRDAAALDRAGMGVEFEDDELRENICHGERAFNCWNWTAQCPD